MVAEIVTKVTELVENCHKIATKFSQNIVKLVTKLKNMTKILYLHVRPHKVESI